MAANYRGIPNHVQIGINETTLTVALERGDFKAAEKFIVENREPSYLDEGPFDKIPLALVLSSDSQFREHPRHLRLARMLVEGGANPNLRIPQAEWQGASPSPMEYLLELYDLTMDLCKQAEGIHVDAEEIDLVDPLFTIGLHDETKLTATELREQLLELMDIFLACGGNPNVTTTTSNSTLYHIVVANPTPDFDLVMKLCEAGGDLNQTNVHGTTPLMDLVTYANGDLALDILHNIWQTRPNISSLQFQNCSNETVLWRAMLSGSPGVAIELLQKGASPAPRALVTIGKWYRSTKPHVLAFSTDVALNGVSAIFAPLLQDSAPNTRHTSAFTTSKFDEDEPPRQFDVHLLNKIFSIAISPVVDALPGMQCFPDPVISEITSIVFEEAQIRLEPLLAKAVKPQDVAQLLFGKLSAGLQQMCVRVIMNSVFFSKETNKSMAFIAKLKGKKIVAQDQDKRDWDGNESAQWDDLEEEDVEEDDDDDVEKERFNTENKNNHKSSNEDIPDDFNFRVKGTQDIQNSKDYDDWDSNAEMVDDNSVKERDCSVIPKESENWESENDITSVKVKVEGSKEENWDSNEGIMESNACVKVDRDSPKEPENWDSNEKMVDGNTMMKVRTLEFVRGEVWDNDEVMDDSTSMKEEKDSAQSKESKNFVCNEEMLPDNASANEIKCNDESVGETWDNDEMMEVEVENVDSRSSSDNIIVEDVNNISHWNVVMELDEVVIQKLVKEHLKLPASLVSRFEIEAVRLQLGASLYTFESTDCIQGCDGQSDEESTDPFAEDESDDGDESDWFTGFMSSDEFGDEFINCWTNEEDSSEDDDENEDDDDDDDERDEDEDVDDANNLENDEIME